MEKNAILLVRVSTLKQDTDAQILDLKNYAKSKGFSHFKIIETKETGLADLDQKVGANELFAFVAKNKQYKTVFATEISRLGRRQSVLHAMKEWFIANQIQLYLKDTGYSLLENGVVSMAGEMMFTMYGLFAESEIKQKAERFARKRRELMEQGLSISGKLLFGYERYMTESKKNGLKKHPDNSNTVIKIYNWYLHGINASVKNPSIKRITLECIKQGLHSYTHSKRNVNKLLKEEAYTGFKTTHNKWKNSKVGKAIGAPEYLTSENKIKYPVIIDRQLFENVQEKLKNNIINADKETKHITLLAKLINCPACGRKLSANYRYHDEQNKNSYRCTSRTDAVKCSNTKSISMALLDNAVWSLIKHDVFSVAKKIEEFNPNLEMQELVYQKENLIQREKVIDEEAEIITNSLNTFKPLKNINTEQVTNSHYKKLIRLDKEKGKIIQEKAKIESMLIVLNDKKQDLKQTFTTNISKIEKSKELLKKYINGFVKEIDVLHQDVKYTIIRLKVADYTKFTFSEKHTNLKEKQFFQISDLAIDKRITRDVKILHFLTYDQEGYIEKNAAMKNKSIVKTAIKILEANDWKNRKIIPYSKLSY